MTRLPIFLLMFLALLNVARAQNEFSVVDYLKDKKIDSSKTNRTKLFGERWTGEKYEGTSAQNLRLLRALLSEDKAASKKAKECAERCELASNQMQQNKNSGKFVEKSFAIPSFVFAEGIGVHGSHGYTLRVFAADGMIKGRGVAVNFRSGATNLADSTSISGTIRFYYADSPNSTVGEMKLEKPWQDTIGHPDTITRWGARSSSVNFDESKSLKAEVTVYPVFHGKNWSAPAIPQTKTMLIHKGTK